MVQKNVAISNARQEIRAAQQSPEPDLICEATLVLQSVEVAEKRANGYSWERSCWRKTPDLKVVIRKFGRETEEFKSFTADDCYSAVMEETAMQVREGDRLEIRVYDDDFCNDDLIGQVSTYATEGFCRGGVQSWSFGQVTELKLRFDPITP